MATARQTPYNVVDDRYFSALGMNVLAGRTFDSRDQQGRTEVVVINETLARAALARTAIRSAVASASRTSHRLVEVIGVVADGKYGDVDEAQLPFMYFALAQHYQPDITVIARTSEPREW